MSEWLLSAKQRARRDQVPTGIRLQMDASGLYSQVVYIQQPDTLYGVNVGGTCKATVGPVSTVNFANVDFLGAAASPGQAGVALVQPGDYLYLPVIANSLHQVASVGLPAAGLTPVTLLAPAQGGSTVNLAADTQNYQFFRQPRVLSGEEVKQLPGSVAVNIAMSLNVPVRTVGALSYYEIVFGPTGAVMGSGTRSGKIVLWMQDYATDTTPGPTTLISIQTRTGGIGAFPVAPGSNAYAFTEDGRAGGI
jgi:hypothetical protein